MASSRLSKAMPKFWMTNRHCGSFSTLGNASKEGIQGKLLAHNVTKFNSSVHQVPCAHLFGFQEANIGRNVTGRADVVMQIDGAWHKRSMMGGAAWIVKDDKLKAISGGCLQSYAASSLQMQVLACLNGMKWARTRQMRNVSIYTESLDLVKILQGSIPLDISLVPTIQEIKYKAVLFDWCCVKKVPRSRIRHARNAAIACRGGLLTPESLY